MSWSAAELDALRRAYAAGILRVTYDGRTVEYAGAADLLARMRLLEAELEAGQGGARVSHTYASHSRG